MAGSAQNTVSAMLRRGLLLAVAWSAGLGRRQMSYGNPLRSLGRSLPRSNVLNCMKNICTVVSVSAPITDAGCQTFQDDETVPVFKRLPLDQPRLDCAFTIFTAIPVHNRESSNHVTS